MRADPKGLCGDLEPENGAQLAACSAADDVVRPAAALSADRCAGAARGDRRRPIPHAARHGAAADRRARADVLCVHEFYLSDAVRNDPADGFVCFGFLHVCRRKGARHHGNAAALAAECPQAVSGKGGGVRSARGVDHAALLCSLFRHHGCRRYFDRRALFLQPELVHPRFSDVPGPDGARRRVHGDGFRALENDGGGDAGFRIHRFPGFAVVCRADYGPLCTGMVDAACGDGCDRCG